MAMGRIDCLRAFVRALEGRSFSAAAAELGIGQPAVSKRIALLESEFGTQLFFRTTRKLRPMPEAHRIYQLAREILSNFDTARANAHPISPQPTGTLKISLPSSFGRRYMMPIIAEYVGAYPGVRLDVRFSERLVNLVEEGIELALRIGNLEGEHARRPPARHRATLSGRDSRVPPQPRNAEDAGRSEGASLHRLSAAFTRRRMGFRVGAWPPRRSREGRHSGR
jgi:DNA-binding transcriptional LysR family regulator